MRKKREPITDSQTISKLFELLSMRNIAEITLESQHAALDAADAFFGAGAPEPRLEEEIDLGDYRAVVRVPHDAVAGRVVVYFHGGGFCIGSSKAERGLSLRIAKALRAAVLVPDYRLAPAYPFPTAHEDAVTAVKWCISGRLDVFFESPISSLIVGGTSAGANLAISSVLALRDSEDPALELVKAIFGITGWYDLTNSSQSHKDLAEKDPILPRSLIEAFADAYLQGEPGDNPKASPLFADLAGLPPVRLDSAEMDSLRDDSLRMAQRLDSFGVEVEHIEWIAMPHMFAYFEPMLEEARTFLYSELPAWTSGAAGWA